MGIKGLGELIKSYAKVIPLSYFSGCRVSIDASIFIFSIFSVALKDCINRLTEEDLFSDETIRTSTLSYYRDGMMKSLARYLRNRIIPIFVFEGQGLPDKLTTREERMEKKTTVGTRIDEIRYFLSQYPPLQRPPELLLELRECLKGYISAGKAMSVTKEIFQEIGLVCLTAENDAEKLASQLVYEGYCAAVISKDTDCFAYGARIVLTDSLPQSYNQVTHQKEDNMKAYFFDEILMGLNLCYFSFRDLCIMCGCDYNTRIPRIGEKTSLKHILKYGSIDNIPDTVVKDVSLLNHHRCREIFTYQERFVFPESLMEIDMKKLTSKIDRDRLQILGMDGWVSQLIVYYMMIDELVRPKVYFLYTRT